MTRRTRSAFLPLLLALSMGAVPASARADSTTVEIRPTASRFVGLVEFLRATATDGRRGSAMRRLFDASGFATVDSDARRRFGTLDLDAYTHTYEGYPSTHGHAAVGAWGSFVAAAAKSQGWDDLQDRTAGLFPNEVQGAILEAMRDAEPAYDALVWTPYAGDVLNQVGAFSAYVGRHDLGAAVHRLATFYRSAWPDGLPLWVAFHPVPPRVGFGATVTGNVAVSQMPAGFDDYDVYASVAIHEVAHRLFAEQPAARAWWLRETMLAVDSPSRELAYRWLDEALATATSNGWVHAQLTGALDAGAWYDDPIIERYARALYPRVAGYLEAGRAIDEAFLRSAVATFEATFPEALTDPDALLPYLSLVTDAGDGMDALLAPLHERYRLRGTMMTNRFTDQALESALGTPGLTVVVLADPTPEKDRLLRRHLPATLMDTAGDVAYMVGPDGHPTLLVRAGGPEALREALDRIAAGGLGPLLQRAAR